MNLTSAQTLATDLEGKNKRHILLTLLLSSIVMQILSFAAVRSLQKSTLTSLLESQNTAVAFQEWRTVRNGILSGWIWWPEIKNVCLFHEGQEVLGESSCPEDSLKDRLLGLTISQELEGTEIKASLKVSQWLMSTGLSALALLPLTLFGFLLRIPIKRNTEAQLLTFLSKVRGSTPDAESSEFEKAIRSETEELIRLRNEAALALVARQVAHDIRSPLSALNMVLGSMKEEVPEKKRLIIRSAAQRINDIANNLLSGKIANPVQASDLTQTRMLISLVDSIVSEKRTQFRDHLNAEILVDLSQGYGLFVNINSPEVSRVISNIINNSVEALNSKPGKILVSVSREGNLAIVTIEDTAGGIPSEIVNRIGEQGATYGKVNGSGLGLFHARKTMEAMNGTISIDSTPGIGTKIKLGWSAAAAPTWFVGELKVGKRQVVSIDDDDSIHLVWKERLKDAASNPDLISISSPDRFLSWYREQQPSVHKTLFLVDYEFLNHSTKGLDLIEQLGIAASSILVTSQFEESSVRSRAEKLGVRLLPKNLAQLIPLSFVE